MNINDLPLLAAIFWQGFSLWYVILVWLQRLRPQFDEHVSTDQPLLPPVPYWGRLALCLLGFGGALGAAGLFGTVSNHLAGSSWVGLVGMGMGVVAAYLLHMRPLRDGNGPRGKAA